MNDYCAWIPVVNRFDLLDKAIDSAKDVWEQLTIIDNSPNGLEHPYPYPIEVFRPPVSFSCPQYFNYMMHSTKDKGAKICIWMHADAEAQENSCSKLLESCRKLVNSGRKWGYVFTNYDSLCAMNPSMMDDVGEWDTFFQQYYCDNDHQRRARISGYEMIDSGLPVIHHGSQTLRSDPKRIFMNSITFPLYGSYYAAKWGGSPGNETFNVPFGREEFH